MSFETEIYDLEQILLDNEFQLINYSQNYARYRRNNVEMTLARDPRDRLFYISLGLTDSDVIELTPEIVCDFFGDCRFKYQGSLTINNLVSFLSERGREIISGNEEIITNLGRFSAQLARDYTQKLINEINLKTLEQAWKEKDYRKYIELVDQTDNGSLTEIQLKRYRIAIDRLRSKG